jgi:hypothetical protein
MAFTPNTLIMRSGGFIEGGFNVWEYTSTDALGTILGAGYFSTGSSAGMLVGDIVWVINQTAVTAIRCQCSASTVTTTGGLTQHVGSSTIVQSDFNLSNSPRNLLDGGDATTNPWQRGTAISGIVATNTYTADRWFMVAGAASSANMTKTADTSIPGFSQAFVWSRQSGQASVSAIVLGQVLESTDSIRLQSQPVSLSFWAKTMSGYTGGALGVRVGQSTVSTDQSASGFVNTAWNAYSDVISTTQTLTASYVRYAYVGTVASNATQVGVSFQFTPVGTNTGNDGISMIGIQLEQGGFTAFEHRDVQVELELCQRYYFQVNETSTAIIAPGAVGAANAATFILTVPVQMRIPPTVTVAAGSLAQTVSGATAAVSGFAAGATHTVNFVTVTSTATATAGLAALLVCRQTNSGNIQISADL